LALDFIAQCMILRMLVDGAELDRTYNASTYPLPGSQIFVFRKNIKYLVRASSLGDTDSFGCRQQETHAQIYKIFAQEMNLSD